MLITFSFADHIQRAVNDVVEVEIGVVGFLSLRVRVGSKEEWFILPRELVWNRN